MKPEKEFWEKNVPTINGYGIVHPAYSHWTLAYALTYEGTQIIYVFVLNNQINKLFCK